MEPPAREYYTFADCLNWSEFDRIEIIDGEAYMMSPPLRIHQEILVELLSQIRTFLSDKPCKVYPAPFGVRPLEMDGDDPEDVDTIVEPDITVVCDQSKLDDYGCKGAPDLIIEILSPSTSPPFSPITIDNYPLSIVHYPFKKSPSPRGTSF